MNAAQAARVAHMVNRAYCVGLGDHSQPRWEEAPEWQRASAIAGIHAHWAREMTPEQSHEAWMAAKQAEGWVYGDTKDPERKEHPCMVPYDALPQAMQVKDYLFRAVANALKPEAPLDYDN